MKDKPCLDPQAHPKPTDAATNTIYNLLKQDQVGCGSVTGVDTNLAQFVDQMTFSLFMASNTATMNANSLGQKMFDFYKTTNEPMKLYTRNKIMIKCTAACAQFTSSYSFKADADALFKAMNDAWSYLKVLCYIGGIGSFIALVVILYFFYAENRLKAQSTRRRVLQTHIYYTYLFVLFVLLLVTIYACLTYFTVSSNQHTLRLKFQTLSTCLYDGQWKKLSTALDTATNMSTFKHWMLFFMILCFLGVIMGLAVLVWVLSKVGRGSRR
jgi:hypothetical protein